MTNEWPNLDPDRPTERRDSGLLVPKAHQPFDPRIPNLEHMPAEWDTIPPEIMETLLPRQRTIVRNDDGSESIFDAPGIMTPHQKRQIDEIAQSRWYIVKNDGATAYRLKCKRCGRKHMYFTLACIEKPFHGLQEIVLLMQQYDTNGLDTELECLRLGTIEPITRKKADKLRQKILDRGELPDAEFYAPARGRRAG